jgi:AraC-like DNA-binding protein
MCLNEGAGRQGVQSGSMSIIFEERGSDSPYIETVTRGWMASDGTAIRPAECSWHMVFMKANGVMRPIVVGPLTSSGVVTYQEGAEVLWVKFKLGVFMPHLPNKVRLNTEMSLPGGAGRSFWLRSSTWQYPDFENVETFAARLAQEETLVVDRVVQAALAGAAKSEERGARSGLPPARTVRHRFLQATGLTHNHIRQVERAQRAAALLRQGVSILDTVYEMGYFDQPHLTRALKEFVGYTPGQMVKLPETP